MQVPIQGYDPLVGVLLLAYPSVTGDTDTQRNVAARAVSFSSSAVDKFSAVCLICDFACPTLSFSTPVHACVGDYHLARPLSFFGLRKTSAADHDQLCSIG